MEEDELSLAREKWLPSLPNPKQISDSNFQIKSPLPRAPTPIRTTQIQTLRSPRISICEPRSLSSLHLHSLITFPHSRPRLVDAAAVVRELRVDAFYARLMLLREWSLFDSMLCSSYVATRLRTWTDNGLKKLKLLLARMGFPLADCQNSFQYMSMEVKRKMRDEFDHLLPEYGLTESYYRSFLRVHGYRSKVSAADVVYGVTALLESLNAESKGSKESSAYSALSLTNVDQLQKGMQSAIEIQRAILRQGSSAITKTGFIRSAKKFRWVKLDDPV